jgi:type IV pilus assembly protein PilE
MRKDQSGFTLLELMIVVVVIAILASFAIPSYLSQVRKSRRSDATSTLGDLQLRQERYRAENPTYGTLAQLNASTTTSNGYYTVSLATLSGNCPNMATTTAESTSNSYWLQAVAVSGTSQAKDTGCTTMLLKNECGSISKTPDTCWSK